MKSSKLQKMVISALCLALAYVLPFLTGQIPEIGAMLCPMHIPVLLCGFLCGGGWGAVVGLVAPLFRSFTLGMPPLFPTALCMAFELATYGLVAGLLHRILPKKKLSIYASLVFAMLSGRAVWGVSMLLALGLSGGQFTFSAFIAGAFTQAVPGIIVQILLVPFLLFFLEKNKSSPFLKREEQKKSPKSVRAILFDLDGTLLPLHQDTFVHTYITALVKATAQRGYDPSKVKKAFLWATQAMVQNNGEKTNQEALTQALVSVLGEKIHQDLDIFDSFYDTEFQQIKEICGFNPKAQETVKWAKSKGIALVLATNPLFPAKATHSRIRWAGLSPEDFSFITTYENFSYAKPNLSYYRAVLAHLNLTPEECLMVGNDVDEDMIAKDLGIPVFLLTDCLLNRNEKDISQFPHGSFEELMRFIEALSSQN